MTCNETHEQGKGTGSHDRVTLFAAEPSSSSHASNGGDASHGVACGAAHMEHRPDGVEHHRGGREAPSVEHHRGSWPRHYTEAVSDVTPRRTKRGFHLHLPWHKLPGGVCFVRLQVGSNWDMHSSLLVSTNIFLFLLMVDTTPAPALAQAAGRGVRRQAPGGDHM